MAAASALKRFDRFDTIAPEAAERVRDARQAGWLMWLAFWTMLLSVGIGLPWDAAWHTRQRFETPFSPPHVFVYVTTALTCGLYLLLLTRRRIRATFGPGFAVPGVPFRVPGPLALIGAGLGTLALGAVLDVFWHSAFGLDETRWSTPHAMLGWGWGLAAFGFVAARLAIRRHRPTRWWTRVFLGLMLLGFSAGPILGPFHGNQTPEKVAAVAAIPVLQEQPEFQHTARIYLDWGLVRANPLFVALGALWFGLALGVLRAVDRRAGYLLILIAFWTLLTLARDRGTTTRLGLSLGQAACWLPVPLLPAFAVTLLGERLRFGPTLAVMAGGAVFGFWCQVVWISAGPLPGALLGALFAAAGAWLGAQAATVLKQPTARGCAAVAAVAVLIPLVTGIVDLYLRAHTPWA